MSHIQKSYTAIGAIRLYGEREFRAWFTQCWKTSYAHGSTLVNALYKADNVHAASAMLRAATEAGWLIRGRRPEPTREQLFFDVNKSIKHTPESVWEIWGYSPNYDSVAAYVFRFEKYMSPVDREMAWDLAERCELRTETHVGIIAKFDEVIRKAAEQEESEEIPFHE